MPRRLTSPDAPPRKRGRPAKPLDPVYGKLTVLRVFHDSQRRRMATTRCECGRLHTVRVTSLYQGFTRSCGAITCRPNGSDNAAAPLRMPKGFTPERLRALWREYAAQRPINELAVAYDVPLRSMYRTLRRVQAVGGVDDFIQQTRSSSDDQA